MYQDFENQSSWKEEHQFAWENLTNDYPIDAIRGRLEKATKEKENIISQRLREYLKAQANNLSSLVVNLLE
ncbi:hypothetical protein MLS206_05740 [Helicobacter pylori]